jgi:flagellar biosynthesis anti-sigma factor FlgM
MRIDPGTRLSQAPDSLGAARAGRQDSSARTSSGVGSDVAQLSAESAKVRALTAPAGQLPEIRQGKVAALAYMVQSGTYTVTSEQTAEALMSHMVR